MIVNRSSPLDVRRVAKALAACPQLWRDDVEHRADERVHLRLAQVGGWEAWLITWPTGHGVDLHDHGGSFGALAVVEGTLTEVVARTAPGLRHPALTHRTLAAGTVRRVPGSRIHDVLNVGPAPATSIHVYAPALATMTFFDDDLTPVGTRRVFPEVPLRDAATVLDGLGDLGPLAPQARARAGARTRSRSRA
jgi:predicted metal-dependent enzyme (double-stranded beta helix superfamily)